MFSKNHYNSLPKLLLLSVAFGFVAGCNNSENIAEPASAMIIEEQPITTAGNPIAVAQRMTVHKSPSCSCCQSWVDYLEEEGFSVDVHSHDDMNPIKLALGMKHPKLQSCHTAVIGDYLIEGHVPASDIKRLLSEKPEIAGLTAPGMPMMSPGMNSRTPKDYAVLSFTDSGETSVYSQY